MLTDDYRGPFADYPTAGPTVARWIERYCTLGGSFSGQRFTLLPFQRQVLDDLYRLDPDTGKRLRRTYVLGLPRKNTKTMLGAALALYHLIQDRADRAPLVVSAAGDREQARLVFSEASRMVKSSPELDAVCEVFRDVITCRRTGGTYKVVSSDAGLAQGFSPTCVIVDELHAHKNGDLLTALSLGSGMRNEPLMVVISTAGFNLDSPLGNLYSAGLQTDGHCLNGTYRRGATDDPSLGMTWWGPEPGDESDPADPALWEKFNPAWNLMNHQEFASVQRLTPDSEWIRYRLNGWTSASASWLPHGAWQHLEATDNPISAGDEVVLGFDGSWKKDSTALVACRLSDWRLSCIGWWESPPQNSDYRMPIVEIENEIRRACQTYNVREITMDPYRWEQSLQSLSDDGLPIVEFATNSLPRMIPATGMFYDGVMDSVLSWDRNERSPAMARHFANAQLKEDGRGGRITKDNRNSRKFIDIAIAAVIAYNRARTYRTEPVAHEAELLYL